MFDFFLFVGKFDSLLDLCLEVGHHLVEPSLFVVGNFSVSHDLLDSVGSKLAGARKELGVGNVGFDIGALDNIVRPVHGLEYLIGKQVSRVGHAQGGGSGSRLGLDDLVSAKLGSHRNGLALGIVGRISGNLGKQGKNGDSGVSTNDGDINLAGIASGRGADKSVGAAAINLETKQIEKRFLSQTTCIETK